MAGFRPGIMLAMAALTVVLVSNSARATAAAQETLCRIKHVSDGDSFLCSDGRRVRLLLIDAPELQQGAWGRQARQHLSTLLPARSVVNLTFDVRRRDQHGRLLAYVQRGKVNVNREMLRSGMAVVLVYPPNVAQVATFRAAADSAKKEKRGLWAVSAFDCLPVQYRARRCG